MNSELSLLTKAIIIFNVLAMILPLAHADPIIAGEILPPASARFIEDPTLVKQIAVGRDEDPVWCYSNDANAILITAPERERERCELKLSQQKEKLEATYKLQLNFLKVELDSLIKKHDETLLIKNKEIEDLTAAALKRPNDYSFWWASGGFSLGVITVLSILWATK
tara:strand:- start:46 stop:546 length:501 start_codon:yes stop_codon:yes gene_type:complete